MKTSEIIYLENLRTQAVHIKSGNKIITDAPTDNHGKGEAFSPTDLLATSLACCMITVMGIEAAKWDVQLDGSTGTVEKIMSAAPRKVSEIKLDLIVKSSRKLTKAEEDKLVEIGENCPVALSLSSELKQSVIIIFQ